MRTPVWARVLVAAVLAAFLGLGALWINRPGLQYDETLYVLASYPRDDTPIAYTMHIRGQPVALMLISYLGALKGWLWVPIQRLWTGSAAPVRLPALMLGAAGLGFLYLLARRAFNWQTALAATALAASDPIYLFTTRLDWGPVVLQRLCLLAGCFALLRWYQKRRLADLGLGGFALGVGVFDKATFLWLLAALAAASAIVFPRQVWQSRRGKAPALAVAGFLLGASPFLYYNWKWRGETFRQQAARTEQYAEKLRGVQYLLQGTVIIGWLSRDMEGPPLDPPDRLARLAYAFAPRQPFAETLLLPAILLALLILPALPFSAWGRAMLWLLAFWLLALAQMLPVRSGGAVHHLALLLPWPHLFVAAGLVGAREGLLVWLERPKWRRLLAALLWIAMLALVGANLRAVAHHYYRILGYGGGIGWSEAIYGLERSLQRARPEKILLLDWGISTQVRVLSGDRLPVTEAAQPQGASYQGGYLESWLRNPRALYVKHAAGEPAAFPQIAEAFRKLATQLGYIIEVVEVIRDPRGRPIFEILAARPPTAPATPPGPSP